MQSLAVFGEGDALVWVGGAAGAGVAAVGLDGGAEAAGFTPALHCSPYAFSVTPRAGMPALSARHSAVQSFAVFEPVAVAWRGAGGCAVSAGLAAGAAAVGCAPPLHCSTYAFSVTPRACIPALSARHSAVQSFAVLANAGPTERLHTTAAAISRPLWIFMPVPLIPWLLTRRGQFMPWGSDCSYTATEPRTSGRKEAAAAVLLVAPIAFVDKAVFPIRDGLERMRPNQLGKDAFG